jgi:hypothetical protein
MPPTNQNAPQIPITLADLETPASGNFHQLDDALTNQEVETAFDKILASSDATEACPRLLRKAEVVNGNNFWASLLVFCSEPKPSFLPKSKFKEKVYGFTLLIEAEVAGKWIIGLFKKGAAGIDEALGDVLITPKRGAFARAFTKGATYQKLSLKRMTASKHELLASSYEANDLRTALPTLGVTRSVPRSLRLYHNTYGSISITPGTFRLQKSGGRCGIGELAQLVILIAKEISRSNPNEFLDVLPQERDFSAKPQNLRPIGVLIELGALLESDDIELFKSDQNGVDENVLAKDLQDTLGGSLDTVKKGAVWDLRNDQGNIVAELKETPNGYALKKVLNNSLKVVETKANVKEQCLFATWINRNTYFRVVFSDPEYFYSGGQLYHRTGFDSDVAIVRSFITNCSALKDATSEKGTPAPADTDFPANTIFQIAEDVLYKDSDYLWCGDLGDEWADYISLYKTKIVFAHCKHKADCTLGAGDYQIVLAQALKNLGNVKSTPKEFCRKIKSTSKKPTLGSTKIQKLRTAQKTWAEFETDLVARIVGPNFAREVHLIITMLSEADFDAGPQDEKERASFTQLIWLLSSFISSCRELGAIPKIICKA